MSKRNRIPVHYSNTPDAVMGREFTNFTPWAVTLFYQESLLDIEQHGVIIFVRAPNPAKAAYSARKCWAYYVKEKNLPPGAEVPEYPMLDDRTEILTLDDKDYMAHWKSSKGHKRYWIGHVENPLAFSYEH